MKKLDGRFRRLLSALVCVVVLVGLLPAVLNQATADETAVYGRIIKDNVRFRNTASSSGFVKFRMPINTIVEVTQDKGEGSWYGIKATEPGQSYVSSGYCAADCLEIMTAADMEAWGQVGYPDVFAPVGAGSSDPTPTPSPTPSPTPEPAPTVKGYIKILSQYNEANLRDGIGGDVAHKWKRAEHATLPYLEYYTTENWYKVQYGDEVVYIDGTVVEKCEEDGSALPLGYVTIIDEYYTEGVNLRDGVNGDVELVWKIPAYKALPYIEKLSSNWYRVRYGTNVYYVNGTVVKECNADGSALGSTTPTPSPSPTPSPTPAPSQEAGGYVTIRSGYNSVNLRETPGGTYRGMWLRSKANVLPYVGSPTYKSGYNWYPVSYDEEVYYVTGQFVAECDASGNLVTSTSPTPTPAPSGGGVSSSTGSLRLTEDKVIFRKTPGGDMIRRLSKGTVMPFTDTKSSGGYTWFYAEASDGKKGYIRGDMCDVIYGTYTESGVIVGYLELTKTGVNLRKTPGGTSLQQMDKGLVLPIMDNLDGEAKGSYTWYRVQAPDGEMGYVRSDCIKITTSGGSGSTVATPVPSTGYVMITDNYVKLRKTAAGSFIKYLSKNEVYPLTGLVVDKNGYSWYPIKVGGTYGYVRHDFSILLNDAQVEAYLKGDPIPSATPTPTGSLASSYLIVTADGETNLRASASTDSEKKFGVRAGAVLGYNLKQTVGGVEWYKAVYKNTNVWVKAEFVKVMTNDEYTAWLAANPDAEKPTTEVISGYVKTTDVGVNLRKTAGGTVIKQMTKGTVMPYYGTEIYRGDIWFYVKHKDLGYGYVVEDYAVITDANGVEIPDATPDMSVGGGGDGQIEASYTTLRKGSSGEDVKAMVAELKNQGYWTGDVISSYNDSVVAAVKKFQTDKNLEVDGVAGPNTLHTLYGTVPVGTSGMPEMKIYPVEKIDWYTGGIQKLWPKGKNVVIMDVKTGLTMWVHRWSGGRHADVEPLTAADTARMCKMYGVTSADQIESKNLWHRRPLWITIGERTFCASMFGFPHNYPDGDTISNNDFKGQFCIHFTNSEIHKSGVVDSYHQEAIQEAYEKAPSRK